MRPFPAIDVSEYGAAADPKLNRPGSLNSDVFYTPVEISVTPELTAVASQAVDLLLDDGFTEAEAGEQVGLRIQAAAAFALTATTQDELQRRVVDKPGVPPLFDPPPPTEVINSTEAVEIAPFLPYVVPYEFDMDGWLTGAMTVVDNESWGMERPVLRWLDLWHDQASPGVAEHVFRRSLEDYGMGFRPVSEVALYSGKLARVLADKPDTFDRLLSMVTPDKTVPLFGELGPDTPYVEGVVEQVSDQAQTHLDGVRQVRHTNYYAGGCPDMDWWHASTLFSDTVWGPNHGNAVLVSVRDVLVGSMEMRGEHSMVALRNIEDAQGRLPLVIGGVYVPRREVAERAKAAFKEQGRWARLDLDELAVRPLRFLNGGIAEISNLNRTVADIKKVRDELGEFETLA
ncbi:MAG TPA: hypothetical protein VII55_01680 [Candidatus Saccharimonadales bacterium]